MKWCNMRIVVLAAALAGCSPHLGVQLSPYTECCEINASGRHEHRLKHLVFTYDYAVDAQNGILTLNGHVVGNSATESPMWSLQELTVMVYFLSEKKKIVDVRRFYLWPKKNIMQPTHFERTFPYRPEFRCLLMSYSGSAREGESM